MSGTWSREMPDCSSDWEFCRRTRTLLSEPEAVKTRVSPSPERHDAEEDRDDEPDPEDRERCRDLPDEEVADVVLQRDRRASELLQATSRRPSAIGRRTERMAGTSPGEDADDDRDEEPPARTPGKRAQGGREARERGVEDEGTEPREEREVGEEARGRAEDGEERALGEEEPEDRVLREADRPEDGELGHALARRHRHRVRRDEEDDDRDDGGEASVKNSFTFPRSARVAVLELLLGLGAYGPVEFSNSALICAGSGRAPPPVDAP